MSISMISFEDIVQSIYSVREKQGTVFVGVSGLGGSGKTTLTKKLEQQIAQARIIHVDDFYKTPEQRAGIHNSESVISSCFDWDRLDIILQHIRSGRGFCYQKYNWEKHVLDEWVEVNPQNITILEGIYCLQDRFLPHYDLSIWVDTPREVRFERGIKRDGEGHRDLWENIWMKQDDRYFEVERPDQKAHVIFSGV